MRNLLLAIVLIVSTFELLSNNLQLANLEFNEGNNTITFDVKWDNSWRDASGDFHDAIWVFLKFRNSGGQWQHADIQSSGAPPSGMTVNEPTDLKGAFLLRSAEGSGNLSWKTFTFDVNTSLGPNPSFKIFGIEMVYIPQGPFYFGGKTNSTRVFAHVAGDENSALLISGENEINFSATPNPASFDITNAISPDFEHNIPATFPKGYNAFYCMKYEITQQQYVDFLNTLTISQQNLRTETDLSLTISNPYVMDNTNSVSAISRNGIYYVGINSEEGNYFFGNDFNGNGIENEAGDGQNIACSSISNFDVVAYLDWAALRPVSTIEVFKIVRGPSLPVLDEFAWGSSIITTLDHSNGDFINIGLNSETNSPAVVGPSSTLVSRAGFAATSISNRLFSGATFYGVMEMTGSAYEVSNSFQFTSDLNFTGSLGDGTLDIQGDATNSDWKINGLYSISYLSNNCFLSAVDNSRNDYSGGRGVRQF